jgi:hypothetical protein
MVLHRHASPKSDTLRVCGLAAIYAFALVTGTAVLMAAFAPSDDGRVAAAGGQRLTAADISMQRAADSALLAPEALVVAGRTLPNDKRGY